MPKWAISGTLYRKLCAAHMRIPDWLDVYLSARFTSAQGIRAAHESAYMGSFWAPPCQLNSPLVIEAPRTLVARTRGSIARREVVHIHDISKSL